MKKHTQIIQLEADESESEKEDNEVEELKLLEEVEAPKELVKPEPKGRPEPTRKDSRPVGKGKTDMALLVPEEVKDPNDPNRDKIRPHVVHFDRSKHSTTGAMLDMIGYLQFLKEEESIGLVIDDCSFESRQTNIVDFAFATQCSYLNLKGICKAERTAKVERF